MDAEKSLVKEGRATLTRAIQRSKQGAAQPVSPPMSRTLGILHFLPVPIVLWLFTRAPLGVTASLSLGVALMATHRIYARRFALGHAEARCLWCGGAQALIGSAAVLWLFRLVGAACGPGLKPSDPTISTPPDSSTSVDEGRG